MRPVLLVVCGLLLAGCGRRVLYEWRDEPYVRPVHAAGEEAARGRMVSMFASDRDIGCRALSVVGRQALRAGDAATAHRIAGLLMAHFRTETSLSVRASVVAVCLRDVGDGDAEVAAFLVDLLAKHDMVASAAYTMATLRCAGAFEAIRAAVDATRVTGAFDLRYELLGALWLLGDARAIPLYEEALAEIDAAWPDRIHHMPKASYTRALRGRLETLGRASR